MHFEFSLSFYTRNMELMRPWQLRVMLQAWAVLTPAVFLHDLSKWL